MAENIVRLDSTANGHVEEHKFYDGFDIWGYDTAGNYNSAHDRAPWQRSPFRPGTES